MAEKYYYQNPKVSDTVVFDLYTPDANCCFFEDPFEVVSIKINFVERNFVNDSSAYTNNQITNRDLEVQYLEAKQKVCEFPDNQDYVAKLKIIQRNLLQDTSAQLNKIEFDNLLSVEVYGSKNNPVWTAIKTDSVLEKVIDAGSEILYGHFKFKFKKDGLRDGDYFINWKWRPNSSMQTLSSSIYFSLAANVAEYIAPNNLETSKNKYPNLLNKYLPDVYKNKLSNTDLSPEILEKFNNACGDAFAYLENLANRIPLLLDHNLIPEYFLPYLGNFYKLAFKSNDPIRWRRQIAKAVPNFKLKGTLKGLESVLGDAGIILRKYTSLYQIYSKYTWNDVFYPLNGQVKFTLSKISLPTNNKNFAVYFKKENGDFIEQPLSNIIINTENNISTVTWIGFAFKNGNTLKILYQYKNIDNSIEQVLEEYLRSLPLADLRNDLNVVYPPKNYNARVIEEDDPLFNELIPTKNPFNESVVFGKIRTEFPYSENIYNMDEYNGSLRDSNNPCDIDKNFLDPCSGFATTLYNLNLEIENLNSERIQEVFNILKEFTPFHSILHSLNYSGYFETIMLPPEESVEMLVTCKATDNLISGNAQVFFNRNMFLGLLQRAVKRDSLAIMDDLGDESVSGFNSRIMLFSPLIDFSDIGLNIRTNTLLEILSPSFNAGKYTVLNPEKNLIQIYEEVLFTQPINQSEFAFRLSNINFSGTDFSIKQESIYNFKDLLLSNEENHNTITTVLDIQKGIATNCFKIKYYTTFPTTFNIYNIYDINPDGSVILEYDNTLPALSEGIYINDIKYDLINGNNQKIYFSTSGSLNAQNKGLVIANDSNFGSTKDRIRIGNYFYHISADKQYVILSYGCNDNEFYISNWNNGDIVGFSGQILDRVVPEKSGNLVYDGITIEKPSIMPVLQRSDVSGSLDDNTFKENFIITINDALYKITDFYTQVSTDYLVLSGLPLNLGTYISGGSSLNVNCKQFKKKENIIYTLYLDLKNSIDPIGEYVISCDLNRSGANQVTAKNKNEEKIILCDSSTFRLEELSNSMFAMNDSKKNNDPSDIINQKENISFVIETKDGKNTKGQV